MKALFWFIAGYVAAEQYRKTEALYHNRFDPPLRVPDSAIINAVPLPSSRLATQADQPAALLVDAP